MAEYFSTFPKIRYFGVLATNITLRSAFISKLKEYSSVYYPFVIEDGDTPDNIAAKYYGDSNFDWLVYMANNIIDPYTQWPKTSIEFDAYIAKKYGSIDQAKSQIAFYRKYPEVSYVNNEGINFEMTNPGLATYGSVKTYDDVRITPESYDAIDINNPDKDSWYPVDVYTNELEENEAKRNIILIDDTLAEKIYSELKELMNG